MEVDTRKIYGFALRIAAFALSITLWAASIQFSNEYFGLELPHARWAGYAMSLLVTVVELVYQYNTAGHGPFFRITVFMMYTYGIVTNILGIWQAQGAPDLTKNYIGLFIPVFFGALIEFVPEPLFVWAIGASGGGVESAFDEKIGKGVRVAKQGAKAAAQATANNGGNSDSKSPLPRDEMGKAKSPEERKRIYDQWRAQNQHSRAGFGANDEGG